MPETLTPPAAPIANPNPPVNDPFAELHKIAIPEPKPPVAKPADAAPDPEPKPDPKAAAPDKGKPVAQPKEEPRVLREKLESTNKRLAEMEPKIKEYESKIAEWEAKGRDTTILTEKLASLEKRHKEVEAQLRAAKHEVSPEFKAKYDEPMNDAVSRATAEINQLKLIDAEGNPSEVKAQFDKHFAALYGLDYSDAKAQAKRLFGEDAALVMEHYTHIHRMQRDRTTALERETQQHQEREKEAIARQSQEQEAIAAQWVHVNKDLSERIAEYKGDPKDEEASKLRNEGLRLYDAQPNSLTERVVKDAHVRQMVGAFQPMRLALSRAQNRIAELEAKLEEKKGSEPGATRLGGGGSDGGKVEKPWQQDLADSVSV
jgi:hypothetical protein